MELPLVEMVKFGFAGPDMFSINETPSEIAPGAKASGYLSAPGRMDEYNKRVADMLDYNRALQVAYAPGEATDADWAAAGVSPEARAKAIADDLQTSQRRQSWNFSSNMLPLAFLTAAVGGSALMGAGAGTGAATGAATAAGAAPTASGVAGYFGMSPGYLASAVNSGVMNTGMGLLNGKDLGDALAGGVKGALLSPVSTYVGGAAGGGAMGNIAGGAAAGGVGSLLSGGDVLSGIGRGAINGVGNVAGNYVGSTATGLGLGSFASGALGGAASQLVKSGLKGYDVDPAALGLGAIMGGTNSLFAPYKTR